MEETKTEAVVQAATEDQTAALERERMKFEYQVEKEVAAKTASLEHSDTLGSIAGALAKAQGGMKNASKTSEGYGYNFADIGSNFDAVRKQLSDNALAITHGHSLKNTDKPVVFTTVMLMHESGEWIKSTLEVPLTVMKGLSIPQSIGVVCTYSRRYLLQAVTGLASEDNDATAK